VTSCTLSAVIHVEGLLDWIIPHHVRRLHWKKVNDSMPTRGVRTQVFSSPDPRGRNPVCNTNMKFESC